MFDDHCLPAVAEKLPSQRDRGRLLKGRLLHGTAHDGEQLIERAIQCGTAAVFALGLRVTRDRLLDTQLGFYKAGGGRDTDHNRLANHCELGRQAGGYGQIVKPGIAGDLAVGLDHDVCIAGHAFAGGVFDHAEHVAVNAHIGAVDNGPFQGVPVAAGQVANGAVRAFVRARIAGDEGFEIAPEPQVAVLSVPEGEVRLQRLARLGMPALLGHPLVHRVQGIKAQESGLVPRHIQDLHAVSTIT